MPKNAKQEKGLRGYGIGRSCDPSGYGNRGLFQSERRQSRCAGIISAIGEGRFGPR